MGLDEYAEAIKDKELEAAAIVQDCAERLERAWTLIESDEYDKPMGLYIRDLIDDAVALCSQARNMIDARTLTIT